MKNNEKQHAISLRLKQKLSLREIEKIIPVSKSSLSLWLRDYPLDDKVKKEKQAIGNVNKNNKIAQLFSNDVETMAFENWNTTEKGQLAALKIELRALVKKTIISKPNVEGCRYDCIVDENGVLSRVQIKMANRTTSSSNSVSVSLQQTSRSGKSIPAYTTKEIDAILLYIPSTDQICWLPPEIWDGKSSIQMRLAPAKNGQTKGCVFAKDFLW